MDGQMDTRPQQRPRLCIESGGKNVNFSIPNIQHPTEGELPSLVVTPVGLRKTR